MNMRFSVRLLMAVLWAVSVHAQEYRIDRPADPSSAPVYLTNRVEGRVEVTNLPPVQDVRITGGIEGPIEVQGDVGLSTQDPLPVEVTNPIEMPEAIELKGAVRVDDAQPLRVWVENFPEPQEAPDLERERLFTVYSFRGEFSAKDAKVRREFRVPKGRVFHLTDLSIDAGPDAVLKVRVAAPAKEVAGSVAGSSNGEIPLALLDAQIGPSARMGTPVPLRGEFFLEVEAPAPGLGAPFWAVASGYVEKNEKQLAAKKGSGE